MSARSSSGSCAGSQSPSVSSRLAPTLLTNARVGGVGMQRFADEFVGDIRAVELRGVDVVDAQLDCALEHGERLVVVARRAEHTGPG